jgi:F0F1-type ATP synthase assembly protein I
MPSEGPARKVRRGGDGGNGNGEDRRLVLARSFEFMQESLRRSGPAAVAGYTLIGSIILLGAIGYAIDQWRGTSPGFLLAGLLLGIVVGFYELAKVVWRK